MKKVTNKDAQCTLKMRIVTGLPLYVRFTKICRQVSSKRWGFFRARNLFVCRGRHNKYLQLPTKDRECPCLHSLWRCPIESSTLNALVFLRPFYSRVCVTFCLGLFQKHTQGCLTFFSNLLGITLKTKRLPYSGPAASLRESKVSRQSLLMHR